MDDIIEPIESTIEDTSDWFLLTIEHKWSKTARIDKDIALIKKCRDMTISLLNEMDKRWVSIEHYEECTTPSGQKRHWLFT